ncbi:hypothetical protein GOP47_0018986 [Adiantum capillus-veneris]|uniref:Poly [ADP-ribose] polymerase n=1 Tax=Adiantum capillus-veneris TaxID=13818 RepID=A0A9D4UER4_ADICA|nr:hypothetical protein GOP47_0018986 [Adiantum capillus-veneris]
MPFSSTSNLSINPIKEKGAAIKEQDSQEDNEEQEEYDHLWDDIKRVDHTRSKNREDTNWLSKDFLQLPDLQQHKTQLFKSLPLVNFDLNGYSWLLEADPWELSSEHRCILILLIMQKNLDDCSRRFAEIKEQYDQVCLENAEINKQRRIAILREAQVIGMTTTGAAINQDILAAVSPAIVLVEEAAEILEPHLMAFLSPNVKHLILVGDHKQLRPSVKCHQLQVRHNLGISMLERLAEHNQLPFQTLGLQSRMREEFLQMIQPIYLNLRSNLSVVNGVRNRPAKCMKSTFYFWNHPVEETAARSPSNKREAYMVLALIKWLLSEGHKHHEITVICAYNGQVTEIRKLLSEHKQGEESVDVQTIDRFQVKDRTEKFIQPTHSILPVVTKIEKVTNTKLQLNFLQAQRDSIDVLQPTQLLFHGTNDEGIKGITTDGFRLPPPHKNNMFGRGVYFATDSSKSAHQLYTKGSNKLLLCEVLIGRPWSLTSARPDLDYKTVRKNYDSVFSVRNSKASGGTEFDEYVIYNPDQALPKYVVHYKNMDSNALTLQTLQNKANLAFERRVLDASPSSYKGDTIDEMHFRFAEAQFFRMSTNKIRKVKKVEFVWNQVLYDRYQNVKQQFLAERKPVDEILVFHGTNAESIDKIVKEGFKVGGTDGVPIRCGTAYGHGVYTAANPDTSIPYSGGSGMMLLSNAMCGKLGEDDKKGGSEDIYVVTKGEQLLPKYIVHFQ